MEYKTWKCPYCKKYRRHETVTCREVSAIEKDTEAVQFINGFNDIIGISKIITVATGRDFWKCCGCGLITLRSSSGNIIRLVDDESNPAYNEAFKILEGERWKALMENEDIPTINIELFKDKEK